MVALIPSLLSILAPAAAIAIPAASISLGNAEHNIDRRFNHGQCGIHVEQWKSPAGISMEVKDARGKIIGNILRKNFNGNTINVSSQLQNTIVVTLKADNALEFKKGGDSWSTTGGRCSVGGFDNGSRQLDCGFAC